MKNYRRIFAKLTQPQSRRLKRLTVGLNRMRLRLQTISRWGLKSLARCCAPPNGSRSDSTNLRVWGGVIWTATKRHCEKLVLLMLPENRSPNVSKKLRLINQPEGRLSWPANS